MDEEVKHLIRTVSRAFYPHQCVLILDALLYHSVLFEDDLVKLLSTHKKGFRGYVHKLIEDRMIVSYTQKENGGAANKVATKTYLYIHFIEAIDAIKWKIHCIVRDVKKQYAKSNDIQGYVCPNCGTKYSLIDAASLTNDDRTAFICSVCQTVLVEDNSDLEAKEGQEKLEKLMKDLQGIIESLKRIDSMKIEDNNFETALIKSIPAQSSSAASYTVSNKSGRNKKSFYNDNLENLSRKAQATIHVDIQGEAERLDSERKERESKNAKLLQNALPEWHMQSTVGGDELGHLDETEENGEVKEEGEEDENGEVKSEVKQEGDDGVKVKKEDKGDADSQDNKETTPVTQATKEENEEKVALDDYYQQLEKRQKEEEMAEEEEEEEEEDDDEFDDFMDDDEMEEEEMQDVEIGADSRPDEGSKDAGESKAAADSATATPSNANGDGDDDDDDDFDNMDFEDIEDINANESDAE